MYHVDQILTAVYMGPKYIVKQEHIFVLNVIRILIVALGKFAIVMGQVPVLRVILIQTALLFPMHNVQATAVFRVLHPQIVHLILDKQNVIAEEYVFSALITLHAPYQLRIVTLHHLFAGLV